MTGPKLDDGWVRAREVLANFIVTSSKTFFNNTNMKIQFCNFVNQNFIELLPTPQHKDVISCAEN